MARDEADRQQSDDMDLLVEVSDQAGKGMRRVNSRITNSSGNSARWGESARKHG